MIRPLVALLVLLTAPAAHAGAQEDFVPLRADGNGIPALRRVVPFHARRQPLGDALRLVARTAAIGFIAPADLAALATPVSVDADTLPASALLLRLVRGTDVELLVAASGPTLVARARHGARLAPSTRPLAGVVRDSATGEPTAGAWVEIGDERLTPSARTRSRADGRFAFDSAPTTPLVLRVRQLGYAPARHAVPAGSAAAVEIRLARAATALSTVVVTPGFYGVMEQRVAAAQTLTREQIRAAPQVGEDLFRSVNRLPGVSASDFSAAFRVRGGANDEVYASLDGLELVEPFHLKDFDGALSIVDVGAVAGLDLTTGGFGAQYGNRLTGVLAMRTLDPPPDAARRTELALTLTTLRATSHGSFAGGRGGWLLSARRGFLEYALRAAREDDDLRPRYYDVLAKGTYGFRSGAVLSLHALHAGDRLTYQDDVDDPRLVSAYGSSYVWGTLRARPRADLSTESVLSAGSLTWDRQGTRVSPFDGASDLHVDDDRRLRFAALRHEWQWERSPRLLFGWGGEGKVLRASYAYDRRERQLRTAGGRVEVITDTLGVGAEPSGTSAGAYVTARARPVARVTVEAGLRADAQSYTGETQVSPRVALALDATSQTTVRAAWGRYAQPQGIHQLQVQDGVTQFDAAERAEHRVLGVERRMGGGVTARAEMYERRLLELRPRFVSVDNSIDVFPEVEPDRRRVVPERGSARGVELFVTRAAARRVTWAASYAFAVARDEERGVRVPRPLDQRHTVALDLTWRPGAAWRLSGAWLYHTGWPTTSFTFAADTVADGEGGGSVFVRRVYGERNAERLAPYHRLDLRASRDIALGRTRLSAFVDLFNVYDRRNPRAFDPRVTVSNGRVTFARGVDALLPRLPSFGVSWGF